MAPPVETARRAVPLQWAGKGATLAQLRGCLAGARVPESCAIPASRWHRQRDGVLDELSLRFGRARLIVRSDRVGEDTPHVSSAGRYLSVACERAGAREELAAAIDAVFACYGSPCGDDGVLVQPRVENIVQAGVAFTHALPDGAPYYSIGVAPGPRSDVVTRGDAAVDTWHVARDHARDAELPPFVRTCLDVLRDIECRAGGDPCEIEIVLDADGSACLLQARPLPATARASQAGVATLRRQVEADLSRQLRRPLLGLMPDWNPAELLGEHPRPLARSVFDRLITRRAWRIGRAALGHASADSGALLRVCAGRPYIDVRTSFRSLLPSGLRASLGERVVEAACARLRTQPQLHDKVEYEVMPSALTVGFADDFARRYPGALAPAEIDELARSLRATMQRALEPSRCARLRAGFERDLTLGPAPLEPARLARWITRLELRGAARFAQIARQAFALDALLRSAVATGDLDPGVLDQIRGRGGLGGIDLGDDGHVRSGTFELLAPPRREWHAAATTERRHAQVDSPLPDAASLARLQCALDALGLDCSVSALLTQYRRVLQARELGKFTLARGVSHLLDALAERARALGLDRDEAGWLELDDLLAADARTPALRAAAASARRRHALEARVRLPLLIDGAKLGVVRHPPGQANWFGAGRVRARPVVVDLATQPDSVPLHALVAVASADPGFDWIFHRRPLALVTAFGGPNSHMAIRCAEARVPALLGVGPEAFRRIAGAVEATIDFDDARWSCT